MDDGVLSEHGVPIEQGPDVMPLVETKAPLAMVRASDTIASVAHLMEVAIKEKMPVDTLAKLQEMVIVQQDRLAAERFNEALAKFHSECPIIPKSTTSNIVTKSGSRYSYQYAKLDTLEHVCRPICQRNGLSYSWSTVAGATPKSIVSTCILTHVGGHSREASFPCVVGAPPGSGMSEQQQYSSALTTARRQTFIQVLGLPVVDPDLDGGDPPQDVQPMTEDNVRQIEDMIISVEQHLGQKIRDKFLAHMGVKAVSDLPASRFDEAMEALEKKMKGTPVIPPS